MHVFEQVRILLLYENYGNCRAQTSEVLDVSCLQNLHTLFIGDERECVRISQPMKNLKSIVMSRGAFLDFSYYFKYIPNLEIVAFFENPQEGFISELQKLLRTPKILNKLQHLYITHDKWCMFVPENCQC